MPSTSYGSPMPRFRLGALAGAAVLLFASASIHAQQIRDSVLEFEQPELNPAYDAGIGGPSFSAPMFSSSNAVPLKFEAVNQYDAASFARNFIPPDTMGAVGRSQYMAVTNGVYGIFDKATGARLSVTSDVSFWAAAGQTGASGDSRIMFNAEANRWVVTSFGANTSDIQIAVSNTADALGGWKSVKFTGYAGGTADYPTLALDKNALYIGTNNYQVGCQSSAPTQNTFCGTTLNVIPLNSLFNAGTPSVANMKQFTTPYDYLSGGADRGFAIQGVNSKTAGSTGKVVANSLYYTDAAKGIGDNITYKVTGLTSSSAAGAATTAPVYAGSTVVDVSGPARQPNKVADVQTQAPPVDFPNNNRVIDSLDTRISSSVYEAGGRIYELNTITPVGTDESRVHYTVLDANTFAMLSQGDIGSAGYDYYQGSIAVNENGQVVIGYNRSGSDAATGNISILAQAFKTASNGSLVAISDEMLIQTSLVDDYHNGTVDGQVAKGRQRWGDYSQVSIDPNDPTKFWLIGEYAREYNDAAGGHPGGSGGSRWSTFVAEVNVSALAAVPEASSGLLMALGLGGIGLSLRRRRRQVADA